jgi:hypothetical protein
MRAFHPMRAARKTFLARRAKAETIDGGRDRQPVTSDPTEATIERAQPDADERIDPMTLASIHQAQRHADAETGAGMHARIDRAQQTAEDELATGSHTRPSTKHSARATSSSTVALTPASMSFWRASLTVFTRPIGVPKPRARCLVIDQYRQKAADRYATARR